MPNSSPPYFFIFFSIFLAITSVSLQSQCLNNQKTLLLELKSELNFNSSYSTKLVYWNQSHDCCSWVGVKCGASGHVTGLRLRNESISGEITNSSSLFHLRHLEELDLNSNALSGNIPHSFFHLHSLRYLYLSNNLFNGTFQLENVQSLPNLVVLELSRNELSVEVTNTNSSRNQFPDLYALRLASCNLSVFPDLIENSPSLGVLDLSDNRIVGPIPSWIWEIEVFRLNLYVLNLSHNALTGEIPSSLGELAQLESLDISVNKLMGRIPHELEQLTFLLFLNLSYNELVGMIPNGHKFQTFSPGSFEGNKDLCGFPLNKSCNSPPVITPSKSKEIEWEYVFAALGYVVGLGSIVWTLLCCRGFRERYFEKIEEVVDNIFYQRARRRRHEKRIRRMERRKEVRRQQRSL